MADIGLEVGGVLGGVASAIGGAISAKKANKTNLQIARENNALQQYLFNKGNDFTRSERLSQNEWNRQQVIEQREYDSPAAQKQRLIDAGYNPVMLGDIGNGSSSVAQGSSGSSLGVPAMDTPHINPVPMDFDSVLRNLSLSAGIGKLKAETRQIWQNIELQPAAAATEQSYKEAVTKQINESIINERNESRSRLATARVQRRLLNYSAQREKELWQEQKVRTQWAKTKEGIAYMNSLADFDIKNKQLDVMDSEILSNKASANASNASAVYSSASAGLANAQTQSVNAATENQNFEVTNKALQQIVAMANNVPNMNSGQRELMIKYIDSLKGKSPAHIKGALSNLRSGIVELSRNGHLTERTYQQNMELWNAILNTAGTASKFVP